MSIRTAELAGILVAGLADGTPLRQLCRDNGIGKSAVYEWIEDDADFAGRIARARVRGYDQIAEQCLDIADDQDEHPVSRKVRIETRLKLLSKWDPKRYGDKVVLAGDAESPVEHSLTVRYVD